MRFMVLAAKPRLSNNIIKKAVEKQHVKAYKQHINQALPHT